MTIIRYIISVVLAGAVAIGLFFMMHQLIAMADAAIDKKQFARVVDFVRVKRASEVETKKREKPTKNLNTDQPAMPDIHLDPPKNTGKSLVENLATMAIAAPAPEISFDMRKGRPTLGAVTRDSEVVPLVRIEPQYPPLARERGIEGWVRVRFTIDKAGQVENPIVVAAEPPGVFNTAVIRAIRKWKYAPKVVDGLAMQQPGIEVRLIFKLEGA
ncbi:MAG: TonB family protein [Deltaproteobacteria bacterium]|nr:TonB family protein [Deltaproteobacteria bacterium]